MNKNTLGVLGLAKRAGALAVGTNNVLDSVRRGKAKLVLIASDVSDNTKKNLSDKSSFYKVQTDTVDITAAELGKALGHGPTAAIAISDENFVIAFNKSRNDNTKGEERGM